MAEQDNGSGNGSGSNVVTMPSRGSGLEKFLLVPQVAERFGISSSHVYRMASTGPLRAVATRVGRSVRFRASDIDKWIEEQHRLDEKRRQEIERRREAIMRGTFTGGRETEEE